MSDIVERLRAEATDNRRYEVNGTLAVEAADLITALRAENERLRAAGNAIIDFYNGPLEAKRPDIFHRLMVRLNAALEEKS